MKLKYLKNSIFKLNFISKIAIIWLLLIILTSVFANFISPYPDHTQGYINLDKRLVRPNLEHIFGTDRLGRDIFSLILHAGRVDLLTATMIVFVSIVIGVSLGLIGGYREGHIGELIMRIADIFLSFPQLILPLFLSVILGPGIYKIAIAVSLSWWPWYTRVVRSQVLSVKQSVYVELAKSMGANDSKIIIKHIFPNSISPIIIQASMDFGYALLAITTLGFLGLGAKAPTPEWGLMLQASRSLFFDYWWLGFFPGLVIFFTVFSFNILGDSIRDLLDPKNK